MNEILNKSASNSNIMNNSKIKFSDTNKTLQNSKTLNSTNSLLNSKLSTNRQQKSLNNNTATMTIHRSVKKPILEYNGVGDHPIESEKNTLYSTWTPLSDDQTNNKVNLLIN